MQRLTICCHGDASTVGGLPGSAPSVPKENVSHSGTQERGRDMRQGKRRTMDELRKDPEVIEQMVETDALLREI